MWRSGVFFCLASLAWADGGGSVDGTVLSDADGQPLKRALVMLRPAEAGLAAVGVEADEKGHFALTDIKPGKYSFFVDRDGYLPTSLARRAALRFPQIFSLG